MGSGNAHVWNSWMVILMLVWPLVFAAGIWAVAAVTGNRPRTQTGLRQTPAEPLTRRFANGDITREEYLDCRKIIRHGERCDS
jgi:uncharacterized membrane protein